MAKITVIGSGFSSLAAAAFSAKEGHHVTVLEKNNSIGGRARQYKAGGFTFDMGPSWYWMPDVFEKFFNHFEKTASDFYDLVKLDPAFRIYFGKNDFLDIPNNITDLITLFEDTEPGSSHLLKKFLKRAEYKYRVGMNEMVYKAADSMFEFARLNVFMEMFKLDLLTPFNQYVREYFKNQRLISLMEFPVLLLGTKPSDAPALYSLMNYAGLSLGTWYPMGGMYKTVEAIEKILQSYGVEIKLNTPATGFNIEQNAITEVKTEEDSFFSNLVIAGADYHHVEQNILPEKYRTYKIDYWKSRKLSPSCLIAYVGVNKNIKNLVHHNLFFHESLEEHSKEIYSTPRWPTNPLFYVCCPSKTDPTVAPEGMENLFFLMPLAPGIEDTEELRERYFQKIIQKTEELTGDEFSSHIIYKRLYCLQDFMKDYHAFKGNAYGLANTLFQTAFLKPKVKSKKIKNLFFTGHLTVPGPGVPPALISGQIAAREGLNFLTRYARTI